MNDIIAGSLSGFSQMLIGHPFDTLKVNLQNNIVNNKLSFKHFYRGISYPLISFGFLNAIVFGVHNKTYKILKNHTYSGICAGVAVAPFMYIADIGKIKRQMGNKMHISDIYKTRGIMSSFYRESLAFGSYFGVYHYLREDGYNIPLSGAISGLANWTISYPFDSIRSRQMAQNMSFMNAYKQRNLWKGYNVCAIRALLVNSVGFWVYEKCKKIC